MTALDAYERSDDFDAKNRRASTEWNLGTREDGYDVILLLSTRHFGKAEYMGRPDKVMLSDLGYTQRRKNGYSTTEKFGIYSQASARVARGDAPRYSAKKLQEQHQAALAVLLGDFPPEAEAVVVEALALLPTPSDEEVTEGTK